MRYRRAKGPRPYGGRAHVAASWTTALTNDEPETVENIRVVTSRLLALVADHVDVDWYVRVVEADRAGRIALFAEAVDQMPDDQATDARQLMSRLRIATGRWAACSDLQEDDG